MSLPSYPLLAHMQFMRWGRVSSPDPTLAGRRARGGHETRGGSALQHRCTGCSSSQDAMSNKWGRGCCTVLRGEAAFVGGFCKTLVNCLGKMFYCLCEGMG